MNLVILIIFLGAFLGIAIAGKSWREDFLLAGSRAGSTQVASSLLATCLGGSAIFGMAARAYEIGWPAFWWLGAGSFGLFLLGTVWSKIMRRNPRTRTLPSWLAETYGIMPRLTAALLIVVMWIGVISAQLVAAGSVVQTLTGMSLVSAIVISGFVTSLYVIVGGQGSVLRTDALQLGLIAVALGILLLFIAGGGDSSLPASLPKISDFAMSPKYFFPLLIVVGGMYIVGPDMCSRVLTAKSDTCARNGALAAAIGVAVAALVVTFLGVTAADSALPMPEQSAQTLSHLVQETIPAGLAMLVNLGFLAALLSSADTCLLTAASVLGVDMFSGINAVRTNEDLFVRLFIPLIALPAILLAVYNPRIIENIMLSYAVYAGGLLIPLLLLRFSFLAAGVSRRIISVAILAGGFLPLLLLATGQIAIEDGTLRLAVAGTWGVLACLAVTTVGIGLQKMRR